VLLVQLVSPSHYVAATALCYTPAHEAIAEAPNSGTVTLDDRSHECPRQLELRRTWCGFASLPARSTPTTPSSVVLVWGTCSWAYRNSDRRIKLEDGIDSERWPDALLDVPRKVVAHPAFLVLPYLLIIASFVDIIYSRSGNFSGAWVFLYPAMSLTRVSSALHPTRANADHRSRVDPPKPLQSEHWGN